MKTKSAVKWLFEQIENGNITSEKTDFGYLVMINDDCLNKAKEMEKEQIIVSFYEGMKTNTFDPNMGRGVMYYNETYGS